MAPPRARHLKLVTKSTLQDQTDVKGEIGTRLKSVRRLIGVSLSKFEATFNRSARGLQDAERGQSYVHALNLRDLVDMGANANWILTGEGTPLTGDIAEKGEWLVPPMDTTPGAKPAPGSVGFQRSSHSAAIPGFESLRMIRVADNSMMPTVAQGDMAFYERYTQKHAIEPTGVYALRVEDTYVLRRLRRVPGGCMEISEDNGHGKPLVLDLSDMLGKSTDFAVVGIVRAVLKFSI